MIVKYLEFPWGNRPYGGGGWSKSAKYKPLPKLVSFKIDNRKIRMLGKSVFIDGKRKLKVNIYTNKGKVIRQDYPDISFRAKEPPQWR